MKKWLVCLFSGMMMLTLSLPAANAANLVVNGGFEAPAIGGWSIFSSIPGWSTSFGSGIEVQNHAAGSPFEGNQHVELDSWGNSGMIQQISTVADNVYQLSFAYSPRPGVSIGSNGIDVFFNGTLLDSISAEGGNLSDTNWSVFNYSVNATSSLSSLEFRATGSSDSLGGYVDDVKVTPVPEPATLLLLGSGLVGMLGLKKKNS